MPQSVNLEVLAKEFDLNLLTKNVNVADKFLSHPEINRPALQFAGFFEYFDSDRLQIVGTVEYAYLQRLESDQRQVNLRKIFASRIPCMVMCRNLPLLPGMEICANDFDIPIFSTSEDTTDFMGEAVRWLRTQLAPSTQLHGVLLDVYGVGVLIMGDSGIGKSETALEMIKRGHRFVADDAVVIKRVSQETLVGSCPPNIQYFLELRGIGIIDVQRMYGVESVRATQSVDLVIKLEMWDDRREYDRIGLTYDYMEILGNRITCHSVPIRPGRNLAIICEAAALNHRQRKMGYNAAGALTERIMGGIEDGKEDSREDSKIEDNIEDSIENNKSVQ
ncbi:MAG: HPr(Ser) kinase/phosphatase [Defluviitaleaceae bacterium]|nr:HPr(Ser) kinase/phosphatase [Defluviitaleaceae bacterium]